MLNVLDVLLRYCNQFKFSQTIFLASRELFNMGCLAYDL